MTKQNRSAATTDTKPYGLTAGGTIGNNKKADLQALIAAIRDGDSDAFTVFYMGYGDSVVRFLAKFLGNLEDAKEVTQETFALLWENREKLDPSKSLKAYVCKIARDVAVNMIRSRNKLPESDIDMEQYQERTAGFADEKFVAEEIDILYKAVLRRMPPQRRRIFEMSREEGLSYGEIARQLDISLNTVKFHVKAALSDVRSALAATIILFLISKG